LVNQSKKTTLC